MAIYSGSTEIQQLYSGSTEVVAAYSGANVVFGKEIYNSGDPISLTGEWESFWDSKYVKTFPSNTVTATTVDIASGIQKSVTIDPADTTLSGHGITIETGSLPSIPATGDYTVYVTMGAIVGSAYFLSFGGWFGQTRPTTFNSSGTIVDNGTLLVQNSVNAILVSGFSGATLPMAIMGLSMANGDSWVVESVVVQAGDWT